MISDSDENPEEMWEIHENFELGRHLLATCDIPAGQIILREDPLVIVPSPITEIQNLFCLGCYKEIYTADEDEYSKENDDCKAEKCPKNCGFWMCDSEKCKLNRRAHEEECAIFSLGADKFDKFPRRNYGVLIGILRILGLRKTRPDIFDKILQFKYHLSSGSEFKKFGDASMYEEEQFISSREKTDFISMKELSCIVSWTNEFLKESEGESVSEDLIWKIASIIQTNGYDLPANDIKSEQRKTRIQGLYNNATFIEHQCRPNCLKSWAPDTNAVIIRAAVNIKRGDHLSISYVDPLLGSNDRHNFLLKTASFICECGRCQDPTELGSHLSSIRCQDRQCTGNSFKSSVNFLVPMDPLNPNSHWQCLTCFKIQPPESISTIIKSIGREMEKLSSTNTNTNTNKNNMSDVENQISAREEFIQKYSKILHPNHFFLLHVKIELAQLYPVNNETSLQISSLIKKRNLCIQILEILGIICPGCTRLGTLIVNELNSTESTLNKIKEILEQLKQQEKLGNLWKMVQPSSWACELSLDTQRRIKNLRNSTSENELIPDAN